MGNSLSSKSIVVAYANQQVGEDRPEESDVEENHPEPTNSNSLSQILGSSRRTAPHVKSPNCETTNRNTKVYSGVHEVIKDYEILNMDRMGNEDMIQLRPRARSLSPVVVKKNKDRWDARGLRIVTLTPNISQMFFLDRIDLSDNELVYIPTTIDHLQFLERLELAGNKLTHLPDTIGNLPLLRHLDVERNKLKELPESFSRLSKLRRLKIGHNEFERLPECVLGMPKLTYLGVENNYNIKYLPAKLCQKPRLHFIETMGCDMMTTYREVDDYCRKVSNRGTASLLEWCLRASILQRNGTGDIVPPHMHDLISDSTEICDYCNGPILRHKVFKGRLIQNTDDTLCLIYKLCREHWKDEETRIWLMFHQDEDPIHDDKWRDSLVVNDGPSETSTQRAYKFMIVPPPAAHPGVPNGDFGENSRH